MDPYLLKVFLSFFVGGGVIILVTFLAEKLGSRVGGILSGFPTTILVSLLFIGVVLGPEAAQTASVSTLITLSIFGIFCSAYAYLYPKGIKMALPIAIAFWLVASLPFVQFKVQSLPLALSIFAGIAGISYFILSRKNVIAEEKMVFLKKPQWGYAVRFFLGGGVIGLASWLSLTMGEVVGGVMAGFPAAAVSSIIILNAVASNAFAANYIKNQFFGGVINCSLYILAVYFFYPLVGVWAGTLIALSVSMTSAYILYRIHSTKN